MFVPPNAIGIQVFPTTAIAPVTPMMRMLVGCIAVFKLNSLSVDVEMSDREDPLSRKNLAGFPLIEASISGGRSGPVQAVRNDPKSDNANVLSFS